MEVEMLNADDMEGKSIIYVTATSDDVDPIKREWTHEATKELLRIYDEKIDLVESGIVSTLKKMWEMVAKDLFEKDMFFTPAQCENKWKSLKRSYRTKMSKLSVNHSYKRTCPFENEVSEILSKRGDLHTSNPNNVYTVEVASGGSSFFNMNLNNPPGPLDSSDVEEDTKSNITKRNQFQVNGACSNAPLKSSLRDEILELKKELKSQNLSNLLLQQKSVEVQSKISKYLELFQEKLEMSMRMENRKIKQQDEIIDQMKIQNDLLQKLLERL